MNRSLADSRKAFLLFENKIKLKQKNEGKEGEYGKDHH